MAVVIVEGETTNSAAPQMPTPDSNPGGTPSVQSLGLGSILRHTATFSLSPDGNKFIEALRQCDINKKTGYSIEPVNGSNIHACLIIHSNRQHAVLLGFSETVISSQTANEDFPKATIKFMESVKAQIEPQRLKIVNTLIVHRTDYERASNMFEFIYRLFLVATDDPAFRLTAQAFDGWDLSVSTNLVDAENYLKVNSPHAILPRMNLALVMKAVKRGTDGKPTNDMAIVMVVPAYVDFVISSEASMGMGKRYKPLLHFEIHAPTAEPALFAMATPILTEKFALNHKWQDQFNLYAPNQINIGNLEPQDMQGTPYFVPDPVQRQLFVGMWIEQHAELVLDVVLGRAQLPLAQYLVDTKADVDKLRTRIANFFNVSLDKVPSPIHKTEQIEDYVGLIRQDQYMDSRYVDYLLAVKLGGSTEKAKIFKSYYTRIEDRAKEMHVMFPTNWEPLYQNYLRFIDPRFIEAISLLMKEKNLTYRWENDAQGSIYGNPAILNFGNSMATINLSPLVTGYGSDRTYMNLSGLASGI